MRGILKLANEKKRRLDMSDFEKVEPNGKVKEELARLKRDGLIDGAVEFANGMCVVCEVVGLTDEGVEFYKLIENDAAWSIIRETLKSADIDISYPLLKEVSEEIVKRYVVSFIPDI